MQQHRNPPGKVWCTECTSLLEGATVGDYVITSYLGQDSTSTVYLAHQPKLNNRKVVIKVLHPVTSQESIETFRKEAAVLAALSHPYILPIYDYDIIEEAHVDQLGSYSYSPYLVLHYAEQGSLDEIFKQEGSRPWSLQRVLPIIKEAAEALDLAHSQSILHRDVKPANILLIDVHIMLTDFGVAGLIDVDVSHLDAPWAGSPAYMAPEVWRYKPGRYSDQYALAVTCFRLLTGEYPWNVMTGRTYQWMQVHQTVPPQSLRTLRPDLPLAVDRVLQRALAKEPHDRYPDVSTFAAELRKAAQDEMQLLSPPPPLALPPHPLKVAPPFGREKTSLTSPQRAGRRRTETKAPTKSLLSLFALARATLENDDKAYIGKTYSVQAGISRRKFRNFKALPFDLFVRNIYEPIQFDISLHSSDNIELTGEWQKYLLYDPQNAKPQLVEFPFKVMAPGSCSLTLDFYRERHLLQTISIEFDAIGRPTPATAVEG